MTVNNISTSVALRETIPIVYDPYNKKMFMYCSLNEQFIKLKVMASGGCQIETQF